MSWKKDGLDNIYSIPQPGLDFYSGPFLSKAKNVTMKSQSSIIDKMGKYALMGAVLFLVVEMIATIAAANSWLC